MFDAIDVRHDALIDHQEWKAAFGGILTVAPKTSVKATHLTFWENTAEAKAIGECIARNRKLLIENFKKFSTHSDHMGESKYVTFDQAKKAIDRILYENFTSRGKEITDDKLTCILRVGQLVQKIGHTPMYDFMKVLNEYRERYTGFYQQ